jgi:cytochrome b involved in lipid metabolism
MEQNCFANYNQMATTTATTIKKTTTVYYTPAQVALHNSPEDCWVSWLGCVYNLTDVIKNHAGKMRQEQNKIY